MIRAIPERRLAELRAKLGSLRAELDSWSDLTDRRPELKRHHSQIRLLDATLTALIAPVSEAINSKNAAAVVLERATDWENDLLGAHSIWEVFRSKYVLRQNDTFRDYLAACDDLAWACYSPALKRFAPKAVKEPPLVFLSATWSPFAQSRDTNFLNEIRRTTHDIDALRADAFQKVLRKLPIPLVSLPWYQAFHLPGAIIIAHEVGHLVEADFELHDELVTALGKAPLAFGDAWNSWAAEVFADVYGCLAMGPAFAGALIDLLVTGVTEVKQERSLSGSHPPRALRVELLLEALEISGYAADATRLRASWQGTYSAKSAMSDVAADCKEVAKAVVNGPYRGAKLSDVVSLPASNTLAQLRIYSGQGQTDDLHAHGNVDPRYLFTAAQMLHENPVPQQKPEAFKLLVAEALRRGTDQYRSQGEPVATRAELDVQLAQREAQAAAGAEDLRKLLADLST